MVLIVYEVRFTYVRKCVCKLSNTQHEFRSFQLLSCMVNSCNWKVISKGEKRDTNAQRTHLGLRMSACKIRLLQIAHVLNWSLRDERFENLCP